MKTHASTVEPRYNEVPRDRRIVFVITRIHYIGVLFHIFYSLKLAGLKNILPFMTEEFVFIGDPL